MCPECGCRLVAAIRETYEDGCVETRYTHALNRWGERKEKAAKKCKRTIISSFELGEENDRPANHSRRSNSD